MSPFQRPASFNLLLSLVAGRDHQVVIWIHVLQGWGFALDRGCLAIHTRDLQHAAGVMLEQIACEGLPASSHTDHHVLVMQHLERKTRKAGQVLRVCTRPHSKSRFSRDSMACLTPLTLVYPSGTQCLLGTRLVCR